MGITIKDAPLVEQLSGDEKIPISDGSNEPRTVNIEQIKEFANKDIEIPTKVSELENDSGYATSKEVEDAISKIPTPDVGGQISAALVDYVKKVEGKGLSTNDFTNELKEKLEGITPYDPSELEDEISKLETALNTLVGGNVSNAIESFNEIIAFLKNVSDTESLSGIIAGINARIAEVEGKIPTKVSELDNDKGYLNEHQDISHLATKDELQGKQNVIQDLKAIREGASKGATAIQEEQYKGTIAAVDTDESVDDPNIPSGSYDDTEIKEQIAGLASEVERKQENLISGQNIKTINGKSLLGEGNIEIERGDSYDDTELKNQIANLETEVSKKADEAETASKLSELGQELSQINIEIAQAKNNASIAKNAVLTLEGLSNATTAAETLAGQVVQIEENKQNISELNKELFVDKVAYKKLNLLDLPFTSGAYLGINGEVQSLSGPYVDYWRITEYVEVKKEDNITNVALFHNYLVCPIIFYDEEKNIVSKVQTSGNDNDKVTFDFLQIPVEAKYMRVCYQKNPSKGIEFTDNSLILSQHLAEKELVWKSEIKPVKEDLLQIKEFVGFEEISETEEEVTELVNHGITSESKEISYNSDGTMSTYRDWVVSEPILIPSSTKRIYGTVIGYNSSGVVLPGLVYLDSDKEFISAINPTTSGNGSFEQYDIDDNSIPSDARYIVLQARGRGDSQNQSGIEVFLTYIKEVGFVNLNERINKMEKEMSSMPLPLSGMKILCLGDSITKGDYGSEPAGTANNKAENYPFFMEKKYGCTVVNEGRNGGTASSCWGSVVKGVNLDDIDAVVIMFGANGSITDTLSTDVEPYNNYDSYAATQCGSMCKIIEYIYSKKPNISIFVCTPPQAGTKRQAYRDRIIASQSGVKSIAKRYHIPLIDVYEEAGVSDWTQDVLQPIDNLHFGEVGYSRLGTFIGSKILSNLNF